MNFDEPVYNAMVTMVLKQEEREKLFQANNIFTMKLIADLQPIMLDRLQRTVDKDGHLVKPTGWHSKLLTIRESWRHLQLTNLWNFCTLITTEMLCSQNP